MARINLSGMGVALITPFKEDESIDFEALSRLIEYLIQNGTDYLVVLGTTAETPTLTEEEKTEIKRFVVERTKGRIPLVLGLGGNNTRGIIDHLKKDDFSGYDAILSVVPYYNKPSQEGIYQHYSAIAQASKLPIILYNVPGRTGVNMNAETTLRLAKEYPNIIAIKEASGNITQMDDIIKNKPADFMVISGDDFHNALSIHHRFTELFSLLFVDGNPAGVKCLLNAMGYIENKLRLPLVPTRITTYEKIRAVLQSLHYIP